VTVTPEVQQQLASLFRSVVPPPPPRLDIEDAVVVE
jgi:hypothetical protein